MEIGSRVNRIENSLAVGATVLEITEDSILIEYDEGGQGWWPEESLEIQ
tara:strand:+ start:26153 stop:26299 length:147 start_codon:yes stop_codon:yes gene_type:complete